MSSPASINASSLAAEIISLSKNAPANSQEAEYLDLTLNRQIKLESLKTKRRLNKTLKQNNKQRKRYADHIFTYTCIWTFLILMIVIAFGSGQLKLSDSVLIALITTTTINAFGFFVMVIKYLFNTTGPQINNIQKIETED